MDFFVILKSALSFYKQFGEYFHLPLFIVWAIIFRHYNYSNYMRIVVAKVDGMWAPLYIYNIADLSHPTWNLKKKLFIHSRTKNFFANQINANSVSNKIMGCYLHQKVWSGLVTCTWSNIIISSKYDKSKKIARIRSEWHSNQHVGCWFLLFSIWLLLPGLKVIYLYAYFVQIKEQRRQQYTYILRSICTRLYIHLCHDNELIIAIYYIWFACSNTRICHVHNE